MLTAFSQRDLIERARDAGAMAYLVKPFQKRDLLPAIEMATSRFAEIRALETEVTDLQERLETRKLIERAKGTLMTAARDERAGGVPLDPAGGDGQPHLDARRSRTGTDAVKYQRVVIELRGGDLVTTGTASRPGAVFVMCVY